MPFWKQSEDPWDQKPEKRREPRESKDPQANPLDSLKAWNEDRKAKAREKEEAKWLPPEKCPWCGQDMEQGYIAGGRDPVRWSRGVHKLTLLRDCSGDIDILNDGELARYKVAWLCRECGKIIFDIPESERVFAFPESQDAETEETKEEEESES